MKVKNIMVLFWYFNLKFINKLKSGGMMKEQKMEAFESSSVTNILLKI